MEIASRLSFSNKTVVRLFVTYFRSSMDVLDVAPEASDRYTGYAYDARWGGHAASRCMHAGDGARGPCTRHAHVMHARQSVEGHGTISGSVD